MKADVDARLDAFAKERIARAERAGEDVGLVAKALFDVAIRGGKRVRPVMVAAGAIACGGENNEVTLGAGVALEVLHAYLLVHDDWMDEDDVRRGGPSAHAALRERFASRQIGDACAILAGDFGQAFAFEALTALPVPADRALAAVAEVSRMLADVISGQVLDVRGSAKDVEAMHRLKTSTYTTMTPVVLGAILAGADAETREALRGAMDPLGVAFQLRDDWLGTFGDPEKTGKSARSDLRRGKRTALVVELERDRAAQQLLPRVLGVEDAPDDEVDALIAIATKGGAKARLEARITALLDESRARLDRIALTSEGKALLFGAIETIGARHA
ncbi:MAG TPA: polyprenyl synthetase family protein [Polyangiaceae bacterium]